MLEILVSAFILNGVFDVTVAAPIDDPCHYIPGDYSASKPTKVTAECNCLQKEKKCWGEIRWKNNKAGNKTASLYLIRFLESNECVQIPGNSSSYRFESNDIDNYKNWYPYTILPLSFDHHELYCPIKLEITENPQNHGKVPSFQDYGFNCSYKGYPPPDNVIWKFKSLNASNNVIETLHADHHIKITNAETFSTLTILNALKNHSGYYTCEIRNFIGDSDESKSAGFIEVVHNVPFEKKSLGPVIGGVTGGFLLISITLVYIYCKKHRHRQPIITSNEHRVYISHCSTNEKDRKKLLNFASMLKEKLKGVIIVIDLIHQNAINNNGGLSQWIPREMKKADRILVVLSNQYLASFQTGENYDSTKILAECSFIQNMIHNNLQDSARLVILADDVRPDDFPTIFKGRLSIPFPENLQIDFKSENTRKMISLLSKPSNYYHSENVHLI